MSTHRSFVDQVIDLIELIASGRLSPDVINWADLADRGRAYKASPNIAPPPTPPVEFRSHIAGTWKSLPAEVPDHRADAELVAAWMRKIGVSKYTEASARLNEIVEAETGEPARYTSSQFSVWAGGKRGIPKRIRHIFASSN